MSNKNKNTSSVPGIILAESDKRQWQDINAFSVDWEPVTNEPIVVPKNNGIILGYRFEGAIKSNYKLGDDSWRHQECIKDDFMIVRAHEETRWRWETMGSGDEDDSLLTMILNLEQSLINSVASNAADTDHRLIEFNHQINLRDPVISYIFKRLHFELMNKDPLGRFSIDLLKQELTVHLLRNYSVFRQKIQDSKDGLSKQQLRLINDYIETNCHQNIALKNLADLINLSEYHFLRQYKAASNITPYQYILKCRFTRAMDLIKNSQLSIKQIASQVGYNDPSVFSKAFNKHFGFSPSFYRV